MRRLSIHYVTVNRYSVIKKVLKRFHFLIALFRSSSGVGRDYFNHKPLNWLNQGRFGANSTESRGVNDKERNAEHAPQNAKGEMPEFVGVLSARSVFFFVSYATRSKCDCRAGTQNLATYWLDLGAANTFRCHKAWIARPLGAVNRPAL